MSRISVLVEPAETRVRGFRRNYLSVHKTQAEFLRAVLNPMADPNEDQRVLYWRQDYNRHRLFLNMQPAIWRQSLALVAQWKAEDMKARNYFSHYTPEGWGPWDLARMAGVTPPGYIAECIGYGYREPHDLLIAYDMSPSHKQVLEDDRFSHHGTGHAFTGQEPQIYWSMFWLGGV